MNVLGPCAVIAAAAVAIPAFGQTLQLPVVPGVPGVIDSELNALVCLEWDQAMPVPFACPTEPIASLAVSGCVTADVTGNPATAITLNDFEVEYGSVPEQTVTFFNQGSISFTLASPRVRLADGAGPVVGVYDAANDLFNLSGIEIEMEGQFVWLYFDVMVLFLWMQVMKKDRSSQNRF